MDSSMPRPEDKLDWALAIGRAMIAFGQIEHATYLVLRGTAKDPILSATATLGLDKKIDFANAILGQYTDSRYVELRDGLARAKSLATTRNLIAHNPLVFDIYEDHDGSYFVEQRIKSLRNSERHVTLSEIKSFADEVEALAGQLVQSAVLCSVQSVVERGA